MFLIRFIFAGYTRKLNFNLPLSEISDEAVINGQMESNLFTGNYIIPSVIDNQQRNKITLNQFRIRV